MGALKVKVNCVAALALLVLLMTGCVHHAVSPQTGGPGGPPPDQPVYIYEDADAQKLMAAIAPYVEKARSTYPAVRERFLAGLPEGAVLFVTVQLHDPSGKLEQVFVKVESIEAGRINGIIWDDVSAVEGFHKGQRYTLPESDLIDWTIVNADGTEEGNVVGKFLDTWQQSAP